jgi:hypothetical protein
VKEQSTLQLASFFTGLSKPAQETWSQEPDAPGGEEIPSVFALFQNYPNPFNPSTTIRYQLPVPVKVRLVLYNVLGQAVRTLVDADQQAGTYALEWDGVNDNGLRVGSGVYFYRIEAGSFVQNRKMTFLK